MQVTDIYTREAKIITNSEREVLAIINNYSYLQARRYVGDLTGVPYLMAFEEALAATILEDSQRTLLGYLLSDTNPIKIAAIMGIKHQNVRRTRTRIVRRIAFNYDSQ